MNFLKILTLFCVFLCLTSIRADEVKGVKWVEVAVTVPDSAWKLEILEVHASDREIIVVSEVSRAKDAIGLQAITTLKKKLEIHVPDLPVKHYVMGKAWGWENQDKGVEYLKDRSELEGRLKKSKQLFPKR